MSRTKVSKPAKQKEERVSWEVVRATLSDWFQIEEPDLDLRRLKTHALVEARDEFRELAKFYKGTDEGIEYTHAALHCTCELNIRTRIMSKQLSFSFVLEERRGKEQQVTGSNGSGESSQPDAGQKTPERGQDGSSARRRKSRTRRSVPA